MIDFPHMPYSPFTKMNPLFFGLNLLTLAHRTGFGVWEKRREERADCGRGGSTILLGEWGGMGRPMEALGNSKPVAR